MIYDIWMRMINKCFISFIYVHEKLVPKLMDAVLKKTHCMCSVTTIVASSPGWWVSSVDLGASVGRKQRCDLLSFRTSCPGIHHHHVLPTCTPWIGFLCRKRALVRMKRVETSVWKRLLIYVSGRWRWHFVVIIIDLMYIITEYFYSQFGWKKVINKEAWMAYYRSTNATLQNIRYKIAWTVAARCLHLLHYIMKPLGFQTIHLVPSWLSNRSTSLFHRRCQPISITLMEKISGDMLSHEKVCPCFVISQHHDVSNGEGEEVLFRCVLASL